MKRIMTLFFLCSCFSASAQFSHDALPLPEGEIEEDTPVMFTDNMAPLDVKQAVPWVAPDYLSQTNVLGYSSQAFAVPPAMVERVQFWKDIYTKFTTDQGVLHDSRYMHAIYANVDFSSIMKDETLTQPQKEKARKRHVDDLKKQIADRLNRLSTLTSADGLTGDDLRYWRIFEKIDEKNKFKEAAQKGRLRFQLGQRDRFISGIYQSGRYLRQMEKIFADHGLPKELTRLPFVESSFNLKARSKVGASGIWQFMRSTARQYMKLNYSVDERNDPLTATRAAARKLKDNYMMLQAWPLAVTAYNHGPSGVRRLVEKAGTKDIAELTDVRRGRFGFASANFYASFLAAIEVEKEADKHFGKVYRMPEASGHELILERNISVQRLLEVFDGNEDLAKDLNPHIQSYVWSNRGMILKKNFIRVPADKRAVASESLRTAPEEKISIPEGIVYPVARGDTLSDISEKFRVPIRTLMDANSIGDPRQLKEGQKLVIPGTGQ